MLATGNFTVNLNPLENFHPGSEGMALGRMSIEKTYSGDLAASGRGEMLSARTPVAQSAGYVAIEQVTGSLAGKHGSFVLQHSGMMSPDGESLSVEVVPDSGTGELVGISGVLHIERSDGQHHYRLEYEIIN